MTLPPEALQTSSPVSSASRQPPEKPQKARCLTLLKSCGVNQRQCTYATVVNAMTPLMPVNNKSNASKASTKLARSCGGGVRECVAVQLSVCNGQTWVPCSGACRECIGWTGQVHDTFTWKLPLAQQHRKKDGLLSRASLLCYVRKL